MIVRYTPSARVSPKMGKEQLCNETGSREKRLWGRWNSHTGQVDVEDQKKKKKKKKETDIDYDGWRISRLALPRKIGEKKRKKQHDSTDKSNDKEKKVTTYPITNKSPQRSRTLREATFQCKEDDNF
eukprot:TRINITY_DN2170_c5_g1_i2.p1 TRINITY_DN2170_c5_g1~~TRINITY_DN2170_c5_g1_i2.p1  ORF type:complete len:138 (-),score=27.83 TRINITY_DN2170_c5_g1_i2:270-650(-)